MSDTSNQKLLLTLLVDYSGSLTDEGDAASINDFVNRLKQELVTACDSNQLPCEVRCLCYSDEFLWKPKQFIALEEFEFSIPTEGRFSNFGKALGEALNSGTAKEDEGKEAWLWVSDGFCTDEWMENVEKLRTEDSFSHISRYSFHVPGDTRFESLAWFAGSRERVWDTTQVGDELFTELVGLCVSVEAGDVWADDF